MFGVAIRIRTVEDSGGYQSYSMKINNSDMRGPACKPGRDNLAVMTEEIYATLNNRQEEKQLRPNTYNFISGNARIELCSGFTAARIQVTAVDNGKSIDKEIIHQIEEIRSKYTSPS